MPVRIVLDTNVLDSALRSASGASFEVVRRIGMGLFGLHLSVPIALEYEAVLLRHESVLSLEPPQILGFVDYVCSVADLHDIHFLWRPMLRDPGDEMVAELAVAARADCVVTHNVRDFGPLTARFGIPAVTPGAFLRSLPPLPR